MTKINPYQNWSISKLIQKWENVVRWLSIDQVKVGPPLAEPFISNRFLFEWRDYFLVEIGHFYG